MIRLPFHFSILLNVSSFVSIFWLSTLVIIGTPYHVSAQEIEYGQGLLVTTSGKVIKGKIRVLRDGYAVEQSSGTSTYPFSSILCEAKSLPEAYRKQREAMTKPTADQHVRLAQWAFRQQLFAEAEQEIRSALNLQPNNQRALGMLRHFDRQTPQKANFVNQEKKKFADQLLINQEFRPGKPLGGLSPDLAKEFATVIEPLLINRCSNGACHGSSAVSKFRLHPKWNFRGNTRHITAKNLKAVLAQINRTRPDQSPLIAVLDGHHGKRKSNVFYGSQAKKHRQVLEHWTLKVGLYLQENEKGEQTTFTELVGHQQNINSQQIQQTGFETPMKEESALEKARHEQAYDPFDPRVFNRKIHNRD